MKKLLLAALITSSFDVASCMDEPLQFQLQPLHLSDEVMHGNLSEQINLLDAQAKVLSELSVGHLRTLIGTHYVLATRLCEASRLEEELECSQLLHKMICAYSAILEATILKSIIRVPLIAEQILSTAKLANTKIGEIIKDDLKVTDQEIDMMVTSTLKLTTLIQGYLHHNEEKRQMLYSRS
jgi:hypothetical protein